MIEEKAFQINYQDYSFLVLKDIEFIKKDNSRSGLFFFALRIFAKS